MTLFLQTDANIAQYVEQARQEVVVASMGIDTPLTLKAIKAKKDHSKTTVSIMVMPSSAYLEYGMEGPPPMSSAESTNDTATVAALSQYGLEAKSSITFNPEGATDTDVNRVMRGTYLLTDGTGGVSCTGPLLLSKMRPGSNVCARLTNQQAALLRKQFQIDSQDGMHSPRNVDTGTSGLLLSPSPAAPLLQTIAPHGDKVIIRLGRIEPGPWLSYLIANKARIRLLLPDQVSSWQTNDGAQRKLALKKAFDTLKNAGVTIRITARAFDGVAAVANGDNGHLKGFIGSQMLTPGLISKTRDVGLSLDEADSRELSDWLNKTWEAASPVP